MPQSLSKMYMHLVFSTRYQENLIDSEIEKELYAYMGKVIKECDSIPIIINGIENHIHILFLLSRKHPICDIVEQVKKNSSKWIKTKGNKYKSFFWQRGYGSFSVSPPLVNVVQAYIINQKEHHKKTSFKEEYIKFMRQYGIDYDERYMWD